MANENVERVLESRIQLRNDTAANWAAVNPVLLKGEIGIEIDTRKIKIGDGIAAWENLKYVSDDIVVSETNPTDADTDYDIGELWLNKAEYKFFVLIAKNENGGGVEAYSYCGRVGGRCGIAGSAETQRSKKDKRIGRRNGGNRV